MKILQISLARNGGENDDSGSMTRELVRIFEHNPHQSRHELLTDIG
jgi:hypothetical protein